MFVSDLTYIGFFFLSVLFSFFFFLFLFFLFHIGSIGSDDFQGNAEVRFITLEERKLVLQSCVQIQKLLTVRGKWNSPHGSTLPSGTNTRDKSVGIPGAESSERYERPQRTHDPSSYTWDTRYREGLLC